MAMAQRSPCTALGNSASKPIAGGLEHAPAMLRRQRVDHLALQRPQPVQRAGLVGRQDRRQSPFGSRFAQAQLSGAGAYGNALATQQQP
jgi:hypothetical protein